MIKQFVPVVANSPAFEKFVRLLERAGGEGANLLRVLTYHRVDHREAHPWLDPGLISASPEAFEMQMRYLAANYEPIAASDLITAGEKGNFHGLPRRAVVVTFDDAYEDFERHAWPVLKQYRIPAILFVPTAFPDHPERLFWWDRLFHALYTTSLGKIDSPVGRLSITNGAERDRAYKSIKNHLKTVHHDTALREVDRMCTELQTPPHPNNVLSWGTLRRLSGEGLTLGAHTQNHPIMSCITLQELHDEVTGSRDDLTREIGAVPLTFAYPSGIYTQEAVNVVEHAGFCLAFTTERGLNNTNHTDRLRIRRINIGSRTTLPILRAQLLAWSAPFYSLGNRLIN